MKERLKERNNQKRDLLNELMEARKLIWEYKQEATKAKQGMKALLVSSSSGDSSSSTAKPLSELKCGEVGVSSEIPNSD